MRGSKDCLEISVYFQQQRKKKSNIIHVDFKIIDFFIFKLEFETWLAFDLIRLISCVSRDS